MQLLIALLMLALAPNTSHAALTEEFYTWGGFDAVFSAFERCSLIFGGSDYQSLFATLATASLVALVLRVCAHFALGGFRGDSNVAFHAVVPWLISVAIFSAGVLPKGTLHIYDPVENRYQAVGGVPDIIVLFASVSNKIERALVEQVSTAGDPIGFQAQAGGKGFLGLSQIMQVPLQLADPLLDPSIKNYIESCVMTEAGITPGYVSELRRTSTDLMGSLAQAASKGNFTVIYTSSGSAQGESQSCYDAWENRIKDSLNADALANNWSGICSEMGFDVSASTGVSDCQGRLSALVNNHIAAGKSSVDFLRNAYIARTLDSILSDTTSNSAEAFRNYTILNKASGGLNTVNEWLPTIRAVILAVTVALTPFLALLMLTPMFGKAVKFVAASFMFLTVWGVVDATLHQFIIDYSYKLYGSIRQYNMGLDALRFFPSQTERVLSMFGLIRASGLALAGAIAGGVLGMGSSIGAAVGARLMSETTNAGAAAEAQILDPGKKAQVRQANQTAIPTETMANSYSFSQRVSADYARQMGQQEQTAGGLEATGGIGGWGQLQHGQGYTQSYRGQGDVALNKEFMAQAEKMGIPREQAQQIASATVNHGEGLAELRRLQEQGYSGEQATNTYWQGKSVDHMQGRSVGQEDGFTLYRPVAGQENGRWGQVTATWQGGQLVGLQGNTVSVVDTDSIRSGYDKSFGQAMSEAIKAERSVGESITKSWGSSGTWSKVTAAAQQLYTATSGTVDWSKSLNSTVLSSLRNSTAVDERTGQTVDKSAWAQVTAGGGTPSISPIKAGIEGGLSWRVTTSDGKSYTVHQSAEQARTTQESIGQSWRNTSSKVRSDNYSQTAQKALATMESITGTQSANETASRSYQWAQDVNERKNQALARAAEAKVSLDRDFYSFVGSQHFGGGAQGDRLAIQHLEGLAAAGQTDDINKLRGAYYEAHNITPESLGVNLPKVSGPDTARIAAAVQPVEDKIENTTTGLEHEIGNLPNHKPADPEQNVSVQLQQKTGVVDTASIKKELSNNRQEIQAGKDEIDHTGKKIKRSPVERLHAAATEAGKKTADVIADAATTWNNSVPGKITSGLIDAAPKIMAGLENSNLQQHRSPQNNQDGHPGTQKLAEEITRKPERTPVRNDERRQPPLPKPHVQPIAEAPQQVAQTAEPVQVSTQGAPIQTQQSHRDQQQETQKIAEEITRKPERTPVRNDEHRQPTLPKPQVQPSAKGPQQVAQTAEPVQVSTQGAPRQTQQSHRDQQQETQKLAEEITRKPERTPVRNDEHRQSPPPKPQVQTSAKGPQQVARTTEPVQVSTQGAPRQTQQSHRHQQQETQKLAEEITRKPERTPVRNDERRQPPLPKPHVQPIAEAPQQVAQTAEPVQLTTQGSRRQTQQSHRDQQQETQKIAAEITRTPERSSRNDEDRSAQAKGNISMPPKGGL